MWPPRPEKAITPDMFRFYEKRGWLAQPKLNGTASVLTVTDGVVSAINRHQQLHKAWTPNMQKLTSIANLGNAVVVAELMHNKVPGMKDTHYIHDILSLNNQSLVGSTYCDRLEMIHKLMRPKYEDSFWSAVDDTTLVARLYSDITQLFSSTMSSVFVEGVVIKDPKSKLAICSRPSANASWSVKCRKPTKNYSF